MTTLAVPQLAHCATDGCRRRPRRGWALCSHCFDAFWAARCRPALVSPAAPRHLPPVVPAQREGRELVPATR